MTQHISDYERVYCDVCGGVFDEQELLDGVCQGCFAAADEERHPDILEEDGYDWDSYPGYADSMDDPAYNEREEWTFVRDQAL